MGQIFHADQAARVKNYWTSITGKVPSWKKYEFENWFIKTAQGNMQTFRNTLRIIQSTISCLLFHLLETRISCGIALSFKKSKQKTMQRTRSQKEKIKLSVCPSICPLAHPPPCFFHRCPRVATNYQAVGTVQRSRPCIRDMTDEIPSSSPEQIRQALSDWLPKQLTTGRETPQTEPTALKL